MRILIDLGHPAHVHYFRNFISLMKEKGHEFLLVARDKEVLHELLIEYGLPYASRGKGGNSLIGKLAYILYADYIIYKVALKFNPNLFLSFASSYAAHVSWLMGKPHIVLDDTEHAKFELMMYPLFSDVILNPKSFWKRFSKKQLYFDGFIELSYLHPRYFTPNESIIRSYGFEPYEKFFIVRFVSWNASHDFGISGLDLKSKLKIIKILSEKGRVLISAEGKQPEEIEKYRLKINPAHLHHFIYFSRLYVGEGATTASEAVMLGTPAIYINALSAGTIEEQAEKYGLTSLRDASQIESLLEEKLNDKMKEKSMLFRDSILRDKIDVTAFMVWFVENYPESETSMRSNPDYQYNFK